jgi:alginate O-acetyltransferase complex protein AlgI
MIGWVFFRAETFTAAKQYLAAMFGAGGINFVPLHFYLSPEVLLALSVGLLLSMRSMSLPRVPAFAVQIAVLVLSLLYVAAGTYNPFIYFRF